MALFYSTEAVGELDSPLISQPMAGNVVGAKSRSIRASINLASQAAIGLADAVVLARLPTDAVFLRGMITCSVSLGTSTVAIGTSPVHATNGQYRAAAVQTVIDAPAFFGLSTAMIAAAAVQPGQLVYLTTGTLALPVVGIVVVHIEYTTRQ